MSSYPLSPITQLCTLHHVLHPLLELSRDRIGCLSTKTSTSSSINTTPTSYSFAKLESKQPFCQSQQKTSFGTSLSMPSYPQGNLEGFYWLGITPSPYPFTHELQEQYGATLTIPTSLDPSLYVLPATLLTRMKKQSVLQPANESWLLFDDLNMTLSEDEKRSGRWNYNLQTKITHTWSNLQLIDLEYSGTPLHLVQ